MASPSVSVVAHIFNPSTQEAKTDSVSSRPAWLHSENLSQKEKKKKSRLRLPISTTLTNPFLPHGMASTYLTDRVLENGQVRDIQNSAEGERLCDPKQKTPKQAEARPAS